MKHDERRTAILNIAINVAKAVDHLTQATKLLEGMSYKLAELDDELKKPELVIDNDKEKL